MELEGENAKEALRRGVITLKCYNGITLLVRSHEIRAVRVTDETTKSCSILIGSEWFSVASEHYDMVIAAFHQQNG